jgi:ubiquinone/menaquinone biosynthesis C-methylase UbiE
MNKMQEPPGTRTLDKDIPELKPFLKPGMKVLDVGCGTGTITLGVAEMVKPGEVVGIDPGDGRVDTAREWAAQVSHPGNIAYQVGDSHHLDFPDNTFDVVYSHTVMHSLLDPVMALKEQNRVVKKGGWVIASGVRDFNFHHPNCPNWEKLYEALSRYWVAHSEEYHASGKDPVVFYEEQDKNDLG